MQYADDDYDQGDNCDDQDIGERKKRTKNFSIWGVLGYQVQHRLCLHHLKYVALIAELMIFTNPNLITTHNIRKMSKYLKLSSLDICISVLWFYLVQFYNVGVTD